MTRRTKTEKHLSYTERAERCSCLPPERLGFIAAALLFSEDFPDGAFFAHMDEQGIDVSELEPFCEGHKCPKESELGGIMSIRIKPMSKHVCTSKLGKKR